MGENVKVFVLSLQRGDRADVVDANQERFPNIRVIQSVNGYDEAETRKELAALGIPYYRLQKNFETYGTLANWITKTKMLVRQVQEGYPYMVMLEDDMLLGERFMEIIERLTSAPEKLAQFNVIRLAPWGECYLTTLEGARRTLGCLRRKGIVANIDIQLRTQCGSELYVKIGGALQQTSETNQGDCMKTSRIDRNFESTMLAEYPSSPACKWRQSIKFRFDNLVGRA